MGTYRLILHTHTINTPAFLRIGVFVLYLHPARHYMPWFLAMHVFWWIDKGFRSGEQTRFHSHLDEGFVLWIIVYTYLAFFDRKVVQYEIAAVLGTHVVAA